MKTADPRPPFLVMAHHRSGSNFLNDLLQQHAGIECLNEPLSMHTRFFREQDLVVWTGADFDARLLHRSLAPEDALRGYLVELRQYLSGSRRGRIIGFKETCLFGKLGWLKAFVPGLRIVFLRRDARAIVSSVLRSDLAALWRYAEQVPPVFSRLFPGYASRVPIGATVLRATELAAMSVAARYELARQTLGGFDHLAVQLESFASEPERSVHALAAFLGVDAAPEQLAFVIARHGESRGGLFSSYRTVDDVERGWRRHLSARQVEVIDDVLHVLQAPGTAMPPPGAANP